MKRFCNTAILICAFLCAALGHAFAGFATDTIFKKELKIALVLPFHADKVFISDLSESEFYFPDETQVSVEFYQGALLALDSLQRKGLHATVYTFDCGKDSASIQSVLKKTELRDADFIMGPLGGYALKATAEFAKADSIPLVSPLSATYFPSELNPYFFLSNANMKTHCEAIYDYLLRHELTTRKFMVYRQRTENKELVKYFRDYGETKQKEGILPLHFIEMTDSTKPSYFQLQDSLYVTQKNVLLVPSNDQSFVRTIIRKISNLKGDYEIEVYGMPTWMKFDLIPGEQWDSANTVITSSFYLNKSLPEVERFKVSYVAKYQADPTEYSVRGYDEMLYYASAFISNDSSLRAPFASTLTQEMATAYQMAPVTNSTENLICFYTNLSVYFLKYENGRWIKIRP